MATLGTTGGSGGLNTPRDFVQSGWDYFRNLGGEWIELSQQALGDLTELQPLPMTFDVPVDLQIEYGTFVRPTAPSLPALPDVEVAMPTAPTLAAVTVRDIDDAPAEPDFSGLVYSKPAAPNAPLPTRPTDSDPVLEAIVIPDAPVVVLPDDPVLHTITLQEIPDLVVPEFAGIRPVRDFDVPLQTFAWAPEQYDDSLIQTIKGRLSDMSINGLGLPPHIEAALFDRARGREDVLTLQATQEFSDELASRGLSQPGGLLSRGIDRIRTAARQRSSAANRDIGIRVAEMNVEAVKFALSTAISLEVSLVQANTANNEMTLRAAQATQQVLIDLFNAKVTLHNAEWEGFKADAQVFGDMIRALQAEADVIKTRIEGQKLIGEINDGLIRQLSEKYRGIEILSNVHKNNVDAAVAKGTINTQKLEQARIRLQGYGIDVDAWGKMQDAHRTSVDAELGNLRAQEVLGNVHGRRIEAWRTKNAAYFDQARFTIESNTQQLAQFGLLLEAAKADGQIQLARLDGKVRTYSAQGGVFAAEASVSAAESAAHDRTASLRMEAGRLRIETGQKNLEISANYALKAIDSSIAQYTAKAQIVSQLAASTMSGVNFGASYSGSLGVSYSYGRSYGYSGDTVDDNPEF